ncbi:MAG: TRAM domain-containing protein, partial [bacterium]
DCKMFLIIMKILLIIITSLSGYFIGGYYTFGATSMAILGLTLGFLLAIGIILLERILQEIPIKIILAGFIGLILSLLVAKLTISSLLWPQISKPIGIYLRLVIVFVFGYLGIFIAVTKGTKVHLSTFKSLLKPQSQDVSYKILDTSVIIDGRIADIAETGFIEGSLIIPQFILQELQHIADSSDSLKRNRGRRGLDILHKLQNMATMDIRIHEQDFPKIKAVDDKLIELAKMIGGKVVTNDFNLNKVAGIHRIEVLNINELANAVKPVVLPGEEMNVYVLKQGKESGQGIAYLDDGTMIVVDNAKKEIGNNVAILVTSVLQTTAGRMIFGKVKGSNGGTNHNNQVNDELGIRNDE